MQEVLLSIIPIVFFIFYIGYLINTFVSQTRAKKQLQNLLNKDSFVIARKIKKENINLSDSNSNTDVDYEKLLMLLRQEINKLPKETDKNIMRKTFDTKSFNNQKRYAEKIFSDSGLSVTPA